MTLFATSAEQSKAKSEIRELRAKVAWYEREFGAVADGIDFTDQSLQKELLNPEQVPTIRGLEGDPVDDVVYWGLLGGEKDRGVFQIRDRVLSFKGAKEVLKLKKIDIKEIEETAEQLKIITRVKGVWRFDIENLKQAGISAQGLLKALE